MHYLLKIESLSAPLWRLIAVDGSCNLAQCAQLAALAFGYAEGSRSFALADKRKLPAGQSGQADSAQASAPFDSLHLSEGDELQFFPYARGFAHRVQVMRCEEYLYCLMPSCLVGAGLVPPELAADEAALTAYVDSEDAQSLDLRECTKRMRAFNDQRSGKPDLLSVSFAKS